MNTRRSAAAFFVAICLILCGLVLRRQITAHPIPRESSQQAEQLDEERLDQERTDSGGRGFPRDERKWLDGWHTAAPRIIHEAEKTVQGQLTALHAGDGRKAMSYQSQEMQHMFGDPDRFAQMIAEQYPEFGRCRSAQFGPIWSDQGGSRVRAQVTVQGENGHRAQGRYLLIREGGQLRIAGVQAERIPD